MNRIFTSIIFKNPFDLSIFWPNVCCLSSYCFVELHKQWIKPRQSAFAQWATAATKAKGCYHPYIKCKLIDPLWFRNMIMPFGAFFSEPHDLSLFVFGGSYFSPTNHNNHQRGKTITNSNNTNTSPRMFSKQTVQSKPALISSKMYFSTHSLFHLKRTILFETTLFSIHGHKINPTKYVTHRHEKHVSIQKKHISLRILLLHENVRTRNKNLGPSFTN